MSQRFICNNQEQLGDGSPSVRLQDNHITFRVDISDNEIPGLTRQMIVDANMEAWLRWQRGVNGRGLGITVDIHTNTKTDPTQIVRAWDFGDGPFGVLADQELPFGKQKGLLMRIDKRGRLVVDDTPASGHVNLIATCSHEDGHCLGFPHSSATDGVADLMDPMLSDIDGPQEGDIARGISLYGSSTNQKPAPKPSSFWWGQINIKNQQTGEQLTAEGMLRKV